MIKKIARIIQKDFKLLLRSKGSALIVILGPLLLISLVGLAFSNTKPYAIDVSVYADNYTNLSDSLLMKLDESQFNVMKSVSNESCINEVKMGSSNICVMFPPKFDIKPGTTNNITFYVDYSKINLVWMVLDVISSRIEARSSEISMGLTSDLLDKLEYTEGNIDSSVPLVVDLASKNDEIGKEVGAVHKDLNDLDLSMNSDDFNVDYLASKVETLKDYGLNAVSEAKEAIFDVSVKLNDFNVSSDEEDELREVLDDAEVRLDKISVDISTLYTGAGTTSINKLVSDLTNNLNDVESRFNKAASTRSGVNNDIAVIEDLLEKSIDKLNTLQTTLNSINQNIGSLEITSATKIVNPITTTIKPLTTKKTHFNLLFPTLIVLIIMITGVLLGSTLIIVEKKSKSYFRNYITPTNDIIFTIGTYLTALIIMVMQTFIFVSISAYFFKTDIMASAAIVSLILFFVITFFIFLGMFIGALFKSEETTTLAAITVCAMLLFFSSTILPLESMPDYFKNLSVFNPFVVSESLLKQALFFNFSFTAIQNELMMLGLSIAAVIVLTVLIQKLLKIHILFGMHESIKLKMRKHAEQSVIEGRTKVSQPDKSSKEDKLEKLRKELDDI